MSIGNMQTRFLLSLARKMHKRILVSVFLVVFILLVSSCERDDLKVTTTMVEPYAVREENRMGLCVYFLTSDEKDKFKEMQITDPTGFFSWTVEVKETTFSKVRYKGSSDIVMPENTALPAGQWSLRLVSEDGRVADSSFKVSWSDLDGALERTVSGYDEESNLTII